MWSLLIGLVESGASLLYANTKQMNVTYQLQKRLSVI